jgi:hypothetical protein
MFSIMILGIGLVAIGSIFPVASSLQKSTMDEIEAQMVARSARAYLQARGIPRTSMTGAAGSVFRFAANLFSEDDERLPTGLPKASRDWWWDGFYRLDPVTNDYDVYLIVARRSGVAPTIFLDTSLTDMTKVEPGMPILVVEAWTDPETNIQYPVGSIYRFRNINATSKPKGWHADASTTTKSSFIINIGRDIDR